MVVVGGGVLELGEESPLEPKNTRKERSNENPTTKRMSGKGSCEEGRVKAFVEQMGAAEEVAVDKACLARLAVGKPVSGGVSTWGPSVLSWTLWWFWLPTSELKETCLFFFFN